MKLERRQDWAISDVFITKELDRRAPKETDSLQEKLALQELAGRMADHPAEVLPRFVDLAMEMTGGVSAGLSLYEPDPAPGVFRWRYLRGRLAPFEHATTPRNSSPCGVTLDCNRPVLSSHPERVYDWISDAGIVVPEVLLVPLYLGGKEPLGTLWIVSDKERHFDSGHARVMTELAWFVGIALRMLDSERQLKAALEQQERLTSEMSHRVKNLFALTAGIVRVSEKAAKTPAEMSKMVSGRLDALAEADALVRRSFANKAQAEMVDLAELVAKKCGRMRRPTREATSLWKVHRFCWASAPQMALRWCCTNLRPMRRNTARSNHKKAWWRFLGVLRGSNSSCVGWSVAGPRLRARQRAAASAHDCRSRLSSANSKASLAMDGILTAWLFR